MPSVDRRWLPPVVIVVAAAGSLLAYDGLPAMVELGFEGLLPVDVPGRRDAAPRWLALSLMPALALLLWAAFRAAPTAAGARVGRFLFRRAPDAVTSPEQFGRFGKSYDAIVLGVVMLPLAAHAAILAGALGQPGIAARIFPVMLGVCLVVVGNVMPRLRPNWVAGVRTTRTLEDPQLWRTTHRAFGGAFVVAGLLTIVVALVAPRYGLVAGIAALLLTFVVGAVASTRGRARDPRASSV